MNTQISNAKLEKGKWYAIRPNIAGYMWMFFIPKRTVKLNTILKDMRKTYIETTYLPETVFSLALTSRGSTNYAGNPHHSPLPDGATIEASYVIYSKGVPENKSTISYYAERV